MILLVGLGNPGKKYEHTRHNLGRMLVFNWFYDHLNETDSMTRGKFDTFNPRIDISGTCVICQTPETFMNNSGDDVQAAAHFYKIPPHNIWIVMDDLNLDFGVIRTRQSGSDGGHNGLKSILENAKQLISAACLIKPEELTNDKLVKVAESSPPNRLSFKRPKETIH